MRNFHPSLHLAAAAVIICGTLAVKTQNAQAEGREPTSQAELVIARTYAANISATEDVDFYMVSIRSALNHARADVTSLYPHARLTPEEAKSRLLMSAIKGYIGAARAAFARIGTDKSTPADIGKYKKDLKRIQETLPLVDDRWVGRKEYDDLLNSVNDVLMPARCKNWDAAVKIMLNGIPPISPDGPHA